MKRLTNEQFVSKLNLINKSIIPQEPYINTRTKIKCKCTVCNQDDCFSPRDLLSGHGCAYCAGKKPIQGKTDLITWCTLNGREDILEEWDYDLNEGKQPKDYTQGSGVEIVWKCQICKTPMRYKIIERTQRGFGCTKCKVSGTSFPEQFIYSLFRFLFNDAENRYKMDGTELDIYVPSEKIAVEYNGTYYHRNSEEKDFLKAKKCLERGIKLLQIYEERNDYAVKEDENIILWSYSRQFSNLCKLARFVLDWLNKALLSEYDVSDEQLETLFKTARRNTYCVQYEKSLAAKYPLIASQWDEQKNGDITPSMIYPHSHDSYYWICSCGNSFYSRVEERVYGAECPSCKIRKRAKTFSENRVAKHNLSEWCHSNGREDILEEWDYDLNEGKQPQDYSYGNSDAEIMWKCLAGLGHEPYKQTIAHKVFQKTGCPKCAVMNRALRNRVSRVKEGENDLATWCKKNDRMDLLERWDYKKNVCLPNERGFGSKDPDVFWICSKCKNSYKATIKSKTHSLQTNCLCEKCRKH